ncbi:MAG: ABC transporter ATP-binding protein [Limnochordia bacterium]|jgi:ATP-binding cassette subfamily B protein
MNVSIRQYYNVLAKYLSDQRWRFAGLAVLMLGSIGLQVVNPQVMRYFIDAATSGDATQTLGWAAGLFLGMALLHQVLGVGATYMGESVAWHATNALREDLARHCLALDMSFHTEKSPGEFIERIETDVLEFSTFFSQLVLRIVGNVLLLVGVLLALTFLDWPLGIAFAAYSMVTLVGLALVRGIAVPHQKARREAETDLFAFLEERLAGTEDIRSCGAVDYVIRKLYELQTVILQRWRKASLMQMGIWTTSGLLMKAGFGFAMVLSFFLSRNGRISLGTVYVVLHYVNLISRPIQQLTQQMESLQTIGATVQRMSELLEQQSTITDGPGVGFSEGALGLEFRDVSFAYTENKGVLHGISFRLEAGKVLGLLGRTGGGKTTVARLIFRLYDPVSGSVYVNGNDVKQARLRELRQRVAYVTQDVQLFQASVRDNITLFDRTVSDERILEVMGELGLSDWLQQLPDGLDTRLRSGGRSLSAGEAQLLALTRVFLRDPGLVVLDEASSRLDPATEHLVETAIDRLLRGRTAIIIAHRLGTVHRSDDILILDGGRIAEYGERRRLLDEPTSRFHGLHQTGLEELLA